MVSSGGRDGGQGRGLRTLTRDLVTHSDPSLIVEGNVHIRLLRVRGLTPLS